MTLISALLGIAADRLLPHLHEYRRYEPLLAYVDWVRERLSGPAWEHIGGLLLLLLPLWASVVLVQSWTSDWLFGLVGLLFYVAVLVYSGPSAPCCIAALRCCISSAASPASSATALRG
jgi:AmpE protein